jgi:hypothetical protein
MGFFLLKIRFFRQFKGRQIVLMVFGFSTQKAFATNLINAK